MEPERLQQIEELYHAALELESNQRAGFLREACGSDESLRQEVESLLAYGDKAADFIELPAMKMAAGELARDEVGLRQGSEKKREGGVGAAPWLPASIGRYRVLRLLGEGGMGVVYEAEQEQPRRTVALKVIKPGLASAELLRRFAQESQALARLQHPGIAQIHEAGTADTGFGPQPYFAMELVHGHSLRDYAEEHGLSTRQRLELMVKICEAVQHAHQRGLIHRDLKPGNILVDETGQPKILDFGVARVTDSDGQATRQTDLGQLVGTLAYMSPEQVLADPLELDTRSDVYALGVILYELLAGRLPYDLSRRPHEAARTIQEEDPTPLSSVSRLYRGDIETIAAKALEKDKTRRYASASGLAADIQRHLKDEPIAARPPSTSYQLRKFARRHKALVAGVAAVFVVLLGGIITSTLEAARATRERDRATAAEQRATSERDRALRAERAATVAETRARQEQNTALAAKGRADTEAATAKAVNDFLQDDLLGQAGASAQARPDNKPDPDLKVRTALDRAAERIEGKFKNRPLVEASLRLTIGETYRDLGLYPDAERQVSRAIDLRQRALGPEHRDTLETLSRLAGLYWYETKYGPAESLYTKILEAERRVLGERDRETLETMQSLAIVYVYQGKYAQAEPLDVKALELERRVLGEDHPGTLSTMNNLAQLYRREGKYTQAEPLFNRVLEAERRTLGEEHPSPLGTMNNLATLYQEQGRYPEAELLFTSVLKSRRGVLGEEHPATLVSVNNLALVYQEQGKYAQAEPLYTKLLEARHRAQGDDHPATLMSMNNLALLYLYQGMYEQSETLFTRVLETRQRVLGADHPDTLRTMANLGVLYRVQAKYAQAESLIMRAWEAQRRVLGEEHPDTLASLINLADLDRDQGRYERAQARYTKVLEVRRRVLGHQHPRTSDALVWLGEVLLQQQHYGGAEPILREALTTYEKTTPDIWTRYNSQSMLGASLAGQQKYAEAETLLISGYQGMLHRETTIPAYYRVELEQAGKWIVQLYRDWGKPEQAVEWREKLRATNGSASVAKP